jgi:choline dehydrogenase-like flavoprotein
MHTDSSELEPETLLQGDICIIGAGAAGISMALEWIDTPYKVVLLEAGGMKYEPESQAQYRGANIGEPYFPLEAARLRYFGGTTGHWAGFCAPFDQIDFEDRDWVPNSAWPIELDELHPFYARANKILELGPYEYGAGYWEAQNPELRRLAIGDKFWTKMWQFSPPTRFGLVYRDAIVSAPNVHLYTHATVCELLANENVSNIEALKVRTLEGAEHRVQAKHYVMAGGAIQNARLLLASNSQASNGIGNDNDLVGRYFMEHIEVPSANLIFEKEQSLNMYVARPKMSGAETPARGELALNPDIERENRILHGTSSISPGHWGENIKSSFQNVTPDSLDRWRAAEERGELLGDRPPPRPADASRAFRLFTRQEQAPNPDSRITLSDEKDDLGVPRVQLDWRLTELDKRSIRRFYEILGQEIGRSGLGRLQLADWLIDPSDKSWPTFLSGGWHHMGVTKMHDDPKQGVVDANCNVHGIDNLHVAGSATFATAGAPNPTLTLVALTLRLSDHLQQKLN